MFTSRWRQYAPARLFRCRALPGGEPNLVHARRSTCFVAGGFGRRDDRADIGLQAQDPSSGTCLTNCLVAWSMYWRITWRVSGSISVFTSTLRRAAFRTREATWRGRRCPLCRVALGGRRDGTICGEVRLDGLLRSGRVYSRRRVACYAGFGRQAEFHGHASLFIWPDSALRGYGVMPAKGSYQKLLNFEQRLSHPKSKRA